MTSNCINITRRPINTAIDIAATMYYCTMGKIKLAFVTTENMMD